MVHVSSKPPLHLEHPACKHPGVHVQHQTYTQQHYVSESHSPKMNEPQELKQQAHQQKVLQAATSAKLCHNEHVVFILQKRD